jgi:hypothetical protein
MQNKQALVATVIPKTRESLKRFAEEWFSADAEDFSDEDQLVREVHKEALDKLRNLDETRLLEISSKALADAGGSIGVGTQDNSAIPFDEFELTPCPWQDRETSWYDQGFRDQGRRQTKQV